MRTFKSIFFISCLALAAASAQAAVTIYYEINPSGVGSILKYDGTSTTTFSTGFSFPEGLVQDSAGNFYFVDEQHDKLMKVGPSGGTAQAIATISDPAPYDIAIDTSGNLYVANYVSGSVSKYSSSGTLLSPAFASTGMSFPQGLAFDASGTFYVANLGGHSVTEYDTSGNLIKTLSTGAGNSPQGMAFDAAGNLYVAYENSGIIEKFSPTGVDLGAFASGLQQPTDLAFDAAGNLYVTNWSVSNTGNIMEFSPTGVSMGNIASGLSSPTGILVQAPEPSGVLLATLGIAGCLVRRRRKG